VISARELSLSQRLLVGLLIVTFAFWAFIAAATIRDSIDDTYELFDAHLAQTAAALLSAAGAREGDTLIEAGERQRPTLSEIFGRSLNLFGGGDRPVESEGDASVRTLDAGALVAGRSLPGLDREYEQLLRYQIWASDGRLLKRSANAPDVAMAAHDGYSESRGEMGRIWRHFSARDRDGVYRIQVSEAHDVRNRLVRDIALHVISPLVLGMPVLVFLLWFSVTRGLDPLGELTREIEGRTPDSLTPLKSSGVPKELRPVVQALNRLLLRVGHALDGERRLTANAAHELRTPLAAIQAHLHSVRCTKDPRECQGAMDQLQRSISRGIRLVGQLLALARLDPEQKLPDPEQVDVAAVAETVGAELAPMALAQGQTLELHVTPGLATVPGKADLLSMLLANLVDNAIRYTQRDGRIDVEVGPWPSGVRVAVSDNGPGIPESQRQAVFERFYRLAGQDQPGSGLGLAIVRRIVELHDAIIALDAGPGGRGLAVTIFLYGDDGRGPAVGSVPNDG
jgi:signal transduction histidine kinase